MPKKAEQSQLPDVDIREGYAPIAEAIRAAANDDQPCLIWNSDEDYDDEAAPRAVMISPKRYEELLETEWMYQDLSK